MRRAFLTFRVGDHLCSLPASAIRQIAHIPSITPVPGQPSVLAGFVNFHGTAVPVVALRTLFRQPRINEGLYVPLIFIDAGGAMLALLADTADDVIEIDEAVLQPVAEHQSLNHCVEAQFSRDGQTIPVLSPERLLFVQEQACIADLQREAERRIAFGGRTAGMTAPAILADPGYSSLKAYILEHTGLNYYSDKDEDLAARLSRRMSAREIPSCVEYLELLSHEPAAADERDALIGELTIGETYFFRQMEHFELLRSTIIPDLLTRNQPSRRLRVWSAGCATGAEPYSIALLLGLEFREQLRDWNVSILGTDINVDFLAQARTGRFANWALRELPESLRACCFRRDDRKWALNPEYVKQVRFEHHNLASPAPYPGTKGDPLDLILCRNVLIYFARPMIRIVADRMYDALAPGGWLLVGHAEPNAESFVRFEVYSTTSATAYRRPLSGFPMESRSWQPWRPAPDSQAPREVHTNQKFEERRKTERVPAPSAAVITKPPITNVAPEAGSVDAARTLADAGQWSAAADICHGLIEANPLNGPAHFTLGLVLAHTGPADAAAASFRKAIFLDRRFALAHYHFGLVMQASGRNTEARRAFRNVVDLLGPDRADEVLPHGDGILGAELNELAAMHLHALED